MKRIDVIYDGVKYSIGHRDLDELKAEIESALAVGSAYWLTVNRGEGSYRQTQLLITAGTHISLTAIDPVEDDSAD